MSATKLVERFYTDLWNRQNFTAAEEILAPDFRFRGSLGSQTIGIPAFLAYALSIHVALADYRCTIEEIVADEVHAATRMRFAGIHRAPLLGVDATGRHVSWAGAAFFQVAQARIVSLWVLGDVEGLKQQLGAARSAPFQAG
jgi:steroid delta-isomerase-like uncharacterized protein